MLTLPHLNLGDFPQTAATELFYLGHATSVKKDENEKSQTTVSLQM